jgi:putative ABC transport system ATP-binding protein
LLSLLAGLDAPTRGRIEIEGQDLAQFSERELAQYRARRLAIVFQQFHLLGSLTALENVRLPLDLMRAPDAEERARETLAQVGLIARAEHLPSRLSGGECQRVAIARALVVEPALLLADEPSGSLDAETGAGVMKLLFSLVERRRTALVLVTHSDMHAASCERRVRLVAGRIEAGA